MNALAMDLSIATLNPKGQITIPKEIRDVLGVKGGDKVVMVRDESGRISLMNSAACAMRIFQNEMLGEARKAGIKSDEDVADIVMKMRRGEED